MDPAAPADVETSGKAIMAKWRAGRRPGPPANCANCQLPVDGPYCNACGQAEEDYKRSLVALLSETVEHLFHADGRLLHTVPRLFLDPASVTRDYLAGRRASQTPPFRIFLVIIFAVFLVGGLRHAPLSNDGWFKRDSPTEAVPMLTPGADPTSRAFAEWLNPRLVFAAAHQQDFGRAIESRLHEVAILFLPIATLLLGLLLVTKRQFVLFDHAVFSMHSLSFMGALFAIVTLLSLGPFRSVAGVLGLAAPAHLFVHFRGVYGTGIVGTLVRMLALFVLSALAILLLLVGDIALGLNTLGEGLG